MNPKNFWQAARQWWKRFTRKRRLSMVDPTNNEEEWHTHISRGGLVTAFLAFGLLLFVLILSVIAYTPVLSLLPGYRVEAARSRETLMKSIVRLDSMERMMGDMMTYNRNIAQIMDGKTPTVRILAAEDSVGSNKILIVPNAEDSLLRAQMTDGGSYGLGQEAGGAIKVELLAPVEGIILEGFDIKRESFGVRIAASPDTQTVAVDDGTVVVSLWTPETGHVIEIQHGSGLLSVYRNLSESLVAVGQRIKRGEVIGTNGQSDGSDTRILQFELWREGKPLDPQGYIVFN